MSRLTWMEIGALILYIGYVWLGWDLPFTSPAWWQAMGALAGALLLLHWLHLPPMGPD